MNKTVALELFNALVSMCEQYLSFTKQNPGRTVMFGNDSMSAGEEAMGLLDRLGCLKGYNGAIAVPDWEMINAIRSGEIELKL